MTLSKQTWIAVGVTALVLGLGGYWMLKRGGRAGRETPMVHGAPVQAPKGGEAAAEAFVKAQRKIIHTLHPKTARTIPNQRLRMVFGIDNTFTAEDDMRGSDFRAEAVTKLQEAIDLPKDPKTKVDGADWTKVILAIEEAVNKFLTEAKGERSSTLAKLVQSVTLEVSLRYLFNLAADDLKDISTMSRIAERINELWLASKTPGGENGMPKWRDQHDMHDMLRSITGLDPLDPKSNPMNFILPAYETMWRAVFRGLLEINFRDAPKAPHWKQLLLQFERDSTVTFRNPEDASKLYPIDVVKEILRLYPPSRRVYRKLPDKTEFVGADIEACHRNGVLATYDPERFDPERWQGLKQRGLDDGIDDKAFEKKWGFMPFALRCPAGGGETRGFGLKMIALLIAALAEGLDRLDGKWELVAADAEDQLPPLGVALKSGRDDYLSLSYRKVED